jgi:hypothetical protein
MFSTASVQAQLDSSSIRRSQWDTNYESIGGGRVNARLVFDGSDGSYQAGGSVGSLSNVQYDVKLGGGATITGRWALGNVRGTFTFFVAGTSQPPAFSGSWQANGRSGGWNGKFVGIASGPAVAAGGGGSVTYDPNWSFNPQKGYYYKKCHFPAGGYQYVVFYKEKPDWIYWYNPAPTSQVFWCACPTVNNARWGEAIRQGQDLFLMASRKSREIEDCVFPDEGAGGANFVKAKQKTRMVPKWNWGARRPICHNA